MEGTPWSFVLNYNPECAITYPWERCLDLEVELVYYRNVTDTTLIFDLRTRVSLGGGFYHFSNFWNELMGLAFGDYPPFYGRQNNNDDRDLILIPANCCGSRVYLLVPELVPRCPVCNSCVHRCIIRRVFRF